MSTNWIEDMDFIVNSAEVHQFPYVIVGKKKKNFKKKTKKKTNFFFLSKGLGQKWRGFGDKLIRVRDMLRMIKTGEARKHGMDPSVFDDLFILFTDAWDTVLVNDPRKIVPVYRTNFNNDPIVFMVRNNFIF